MNAAASRMDPVLIAFRDQVLFMKHSLNARAIAALEGDQSCVQEICAMYKGRRDVLCEGLNAAGWPVTPPRATMFVWAKIPAFYREMGSLEFSKKLLQEAKVAVSPGVGFGEYGEDYVRFGLIENRHRTRQAIRIPGSRPAGVFTAGVAQRLVNLNGVLPGRRVAIRGAGEAHSASRSAISRMRSFNRAFLACQAPPPSLSSKPSSCP